MIKPHHIIKETFCEIVPFQCFWTCLWRAYECRYRFCTFLWFVFVISLVCLNVRIMQKLLIGFPQDSWKGWGMSYSQTNNARSRNFCYPFYIAKRFHTFIYFLVSAALILLNKIRLIKWTRCMSVCNLVLIQIKIWILVDLNGDLDRGMYSSGSEAHIFGDLVSRGTATILAEKLHIHESNTVPVLSIVSVQW